MTSPSKMLSPSSGSGRFFAFLCCFEMVLLLRNVSAVDTEKDKDTDCTDGFQAGRPNFMLDVTDAVRAGAVFLSAAAVRSQPECVQLCCQVPRCNLALLDNRGHGGGDTDSDHHNRTCVLLDCVYRNRFVCRFVNEAGFTSHIRESVFDQYLRGPGEDSLPIANAGKDVVVQPGKPVLLNGIESLAPAKAHITGYQWTLLSGDPPVKLEMAEHTDQVRLSDPRPGSYVLQLTVTDSNGQSDAANVSVQVLTPELSALYCTSPVKVGPCRAAFPRWHYNAKSSRCEQFVFGGCNPNHNNFLSEKECAAACSGVTGSTERSIVKIQKTCGMPCQASMLDCGDGCCLDRSLLCDGQSQCDNGSDELDCSKINRTFTKLSNIDVNLRTAECTEPPHTGPCRASFTRWYYDPLNRDCHRFTYGGCDANSNNFEGESNCSKSCKGVTESHVFARGIFPQIQEEEEEDSASGSIALAVVFAVAVLAVLALATFCFLRSRKDRSRRSAATPAAQVVLAEQDALVYNPTTKPVGPS